ncbi:hypothetical protein ACFL6S_27990 [Candidatus Poribacteria bacterium]
MLYTSDELYRESSDKWQQGDIIEDLYITRVVEGDMPIRRSQDLFAKISHVAQLAENNDEVLPPFSNRYNREYALIPVIETDVMVVSQTCDIVAKNNDWVTVARVRMFQNSDNHGFLENIRRGDIFRAFYLPDYPSDGKESYATLAELTVISRKLLDAHKAKRKRSFSSNGLQLFQSFIERFFGREAMPDDVIRIITEFYRRLRETELGNKIERVYYDYSADQVSLLIALNKADDNAHASVEEAKRSADSSVEHSYELKVAHRLIDNISLRDIEGFRECR